jgi:Transposase DDE domain
MIVDGSVNGGEFLQTSHAPEAEHRRSRRRKGRCEFSTRLFRQRPVFCLFATPISLSAAPYDASPSVTITSGLPYLRIAFFKNFKAAFLSRTIVTYERHNRIEIMFGRLKDWRRIAKRYDRCPKIFLSAIVLEATVIYWLWVLSLIQTLSHRILEPFKTGREKFTRRHKGILI